MPPDEFKKLIDAIPDKLSGKAARRLLKELSPADGARLLDHRVSPTLAMRDILYPGINQAILELLRCWWFQDSYDPGPPCDYGLRFADAPDLGALHPSKFRPEFGPVFYRGRLDGTAKLMVVGQDPSTDEQLARRSFIGESGQRVQGLLRKVGLSRSYTIFNTFHLGMQGQYGDGFEPISTSNPLLAWRNALFDHAKATNPLVAVLTVGSAARDAVDAWPGAAGLSRVHVTHPSAANFGNTAMFPEWSSAVATLAGVVAADPGMSSDLTPYGASFAPADAQDIPRRDLPWGIPDWFGRGGTTQSKREEAGKELCWEAP